MAEPTWADTTPTPAQQLSMGTQQPQVASQPTWEETEPVDSLLGTVRQGLNEYDTKRKALVAGFARAATLGGSDIALVKSGLVKPETLSTLKEENPITSGIGELGGGAALIAGTGGAGALGPVLGTAAEGAAFGAGNVASDYALGDPDINAQKIIGDIGMGALLGGSLGAIAKGLEVVLPNMGSKAEAVAKAAKTIFGAPEEELAAMPHEGGVLNAAPEVTGVQPSSIDELIARNKAAVDAGHITESPTKMVALDSASRVELKNPINPLQAKSLENQGERDAYNIVREMPGKEGDAIRAYEAAQKDELTYKLEGEIKKLSPSEMPEKDAVKGGENAIKTFTDQYQKEKETLSPIFEKLKKTPLEEADALTGMVNNMTKEVPGISKMFEVKDGDLMTLPYKTSWGVDKATYNAVKEAVESLKENPSDFEALANIRRGLDQHVDVMAQGHANSEIRSLKKSMMDYMQDAVQKVNPDIEVREAFKKWAINEQEREVIEKAFGASVGNKEFGALSKIKPEDVLDKVFRNTANIKAAKNILEPEAFNKMAADWITQAREAATDKGVFSSNKFNSWLRRNQDSLNEALKDSPASMQRFKDILNLLRIFPDAPSINPSGTAKTLLGMIEQHAHNPLGGVLSYLKDKTVGAIEHSIKMENLNSQLKGEAANHTIMSKLSDSIEKFNQKMSSSVKQIFTNNASRGAVSSSAGVITSSGYDANAKKVQKFSSNAREMSDHIVSTVMPIHGVAPNISQGISNAMSNGIAFLSNKMPRPNNELPFSGEWEPSRAQKAQFNKYFEAVNSPLSVLKEIKNGSLSNESMEALQAVHPHLLDEMKEKVMENLSHPNTQYLNSSTKIALSKFLGTPMEEAMIPQVLLANQATFMMPPRSPSLPRAGSHRPSGGQMKHLTLNERSETQTERLESPREA